MENVPVNTNDHVSSGRNNGSHGFEKKSKMQKHKTKLLALAGLITMLLLLALGAWILFRSSTAAAIDSSKYQAVFFTNGQVYFGKLQNLNGGYMKLNDVFYLQAQAAPDAETSENPQETSPQQASDVQLIKLGSEVHGPDDEMIISKDQILFFENLKKEGKVTDSINKYRAEKQ